MSSSAGEFGERMMNGPSLSFGESFHKAFNLCAFRQDHAFGSDIFEVSIDRRRQLMFSRSTIGSLE
jgi:hypothetical protein